jgi:hypothetical protein
MNGLSHQPYVSGWKEADYDNNASLPANAARLKERKKIPCCCFLARARATVISHLSMVDGSVASVMPTKLQIEANPRSSIDSTWEPHATRQFCEEAPDGGPKLRSVSRALP